MDSVKIDKREVSSDNRLTDNSAKINELEEMLREMKKQLDKVTDIA